MGVVWPAIVAGTGVCSYYTLRYTDEINAFMNTDFATSIMLSLITTVGMVDTPHCACPNASALHPWLDCGKRFCVCLQVPMQSEPA